MSATPTAAPGRETDRLAAIAARCEAATPGPWRVAGKREPEGFVEGHILCLNQTDPEHALDERVIAQTNYHYPDDADQQFIAHSRSDVPWLLERLAAATARVREVEAERGWKWFGNAGHLIVGEWCRFHLTTQVGDYLVSTVGEYWPERPSREIHARIHDVAWLAENAHRKSDDFDAAYMRRFGYHTVGCDRLYETMVFRAGEPCNAPGCGCGLPKIDGHELDFGSYNDAASAARGHMELCEKWSRAALRQEEPRE